MKKEKSLEERAKKLEIMAGALLDVLTEETKEEYELILQSLKKKVLNTRLSC